MTSPSPLPRGRILQHNQVESDLVRGETLRELVSVSYAEPASTADPFVPSIVFLRTDAPHWHRFFLDAGGAFWEEHDSAQVQEDLSEGVRFDLGERLRVVGAELGSLLVFAARTERGASLHVHMNGERRLVLSPANDVALDSEARLKLVAGTAATTYLELLRAHDESGCYEFPRDFDYKHLGGRVAACRKALSERLGRSLAIDDQVQDASFHADVILRETSTGNDTLHRSSVRFSNYGSMVSVTDADLSGAELAIVREVVGNHDFIFVPFEILDAPYEGAAGFASWWIRYFDYL